MQKQQHNKMHTIHVYNQKHTLTAKWLHDDEAMWTDKRYASNGSLACANYATLHSIIINKLLQYWLWKATLLLLLWLTPDIPYISQCASQVALSLKGIWAPT